MSFVFQKLTDLSLRRVYKFVLKRTLGRFLADELLLEQLEVCSGEGVVRLYGLDLNVDVLNQELAAAGDTGNGNLPFQIVRASINTVEVFMSYRTLLTDSCRFVIDAVDLVLAPATSTTNTAPDVSNEEPFVRMRGSTRPTNPPTVEKPSSDDVSAPPNLPIFRGEETLLSGETGTDNAAGLSFIAHWIELIVAKLQVHVNSLNLVLAPAADVTEQEALRLSLHDIVFFNADPAALDAPQRAQTSLEASRYFSSEPSSASANALKFNATKLLTASGLTLALGTLIDPLISTTASLGPDDEVAAAFHTSPALELLNLSGNVQVRILQKAGVEIDVQIPSVALSVNRLRVERLMALLIAFTNGAAKRQATTAAKETVDASPHANLLSTAESLGRSTMQLSRSLMTGLLDTDRGLRIIESIERDLLSSPALTTDADTGSQELGDAQLLELIKLMKKVHLKRLTATNSMLPSFGSSDDLVVSCESEGEFPSSDDSDDEVTDELHHDFGMSSTVFFDADEPLMRSAVPPRSSSSSRMNDQSRHSSALFHSVMDPPSHMYTSVLQKSSAGTRVPSSHNQFSLRVHIALCAITILDGETAQDASGAMTERLTLTIEDTVAVWAMGGRPTVSHSQFPIPLGCLTISLNSVRLTESVRCNGKELVQFDLLSFRSLHDAADAFISPHITITVEFLGRVMFAKANESQSLIDVAVRTEPILVSATIATLSRWGRCVEKMFALDLPADESSTAFRFSMTVPTVELLMNSDEAIPNAVWTEIIRALRLDIDSSAWREMITAESSYLKPALVRSRGGLMFDVKNLYVKVCNAAAAEPIHPNSGRFDLRFGTDSRNRTTKSTGAEMLVEAASIQLDAFLLTPIHENRSTQFMRTTLMSALSDTEGSHKVRFHRTAPMATSEEEASDSCGWATKSSIFGAPARSHDVMASSVYLGSDGTTRGAVSSTDDSAAWTTMPSAPAVLVVVNAYELSLDISRREYNAMSFIAETLTPPRKLASVEPTSVPTTESLGEEVKPENSSFGVVVTTQRALLCVSDDSSPVYERPPKSAFEGDSPFDTLHRIFWKSRSANMFRDDTSSKSEPLKFVVSIRRPRFELFGEKRQILAGISANDLRFYEMTPSIFAAAAADPRFDFHAPADATVARYGEGRHRLPFLHRAYASLDTTALTMGSMYRSTSGSTVTPGAAFELRVSLNVEETAPGVEIRRVAVTFDVRDVTLRHDPASNWLPRLARLMTPSTAAQMRDVAVDGLLVSLSSNLQLLSKDDMEMVSTIQANEKEPSIPAAARASTSESIPLVEEVPTESSGGLQLPFEVTRVAVNLRESLVDFACEATGARVLFAVGRLSLSSTIVGGTPRLVFKTSLDRLSVLISSRLTPSTSTVCEEDDDNDPSVRDWRKRGFARLLSVDWLTALIAVSPDPVAALQLAPGEAELSLVFALGSCELRGCGDSLALFAATVDHWMADLRAAASDSTQYAPPPRRRALAVTDKNSNGGVEILADGFDGLVDRVRVVRDDGSNWGEDSETENDGGLVGEATPVVVSWDLLNNDRHSRDYDDFGDHTPLAGGDIGKSASSDGIVILDDYYGSEGIHVPPTSYGAENLVNSVYVPHSSQPVTSVQPASTCWEVDYDYDQRFDFDAEVENWNNKLDTQGGDAYAASSPLASPRRMVKFDDDGQSEVGTVMSELTTDLQPAAGDLSISRFGLLEMWRPQPVNMPPADIEMEDLRTVKSQNTSTASQHQHRVVFEPGLTPQEMKELAEREREWAHMDGDDLSSKMGTPHHEAHHTPQLEGPASEQSAQWYIPANEVTLRSDYIPRVAPSDDTVHAPPPPSVATKLYVRVTGNFRLCLLSGSDWSSTAVSSGDPHAAMYKSSMRKNTSSMHSGEGNRTPGTRKSVKFHDPSNPSSPPNSAPSAQAREERFSLEIAAKSVSLQMSLYRLRGDAKDADDPVVNSGSLPVERFTFKLRDFLVSFGTANGTYRQKVLGAWVSTSRPRDTTKSMLSVSLVGYQNLSSAEGSATSPEYRLNVTLLPLRAFLNDTLVNFLRETLGSGVSTTAASTKPTSTQDNETPSTPVSPSAPSEGSGTSNELRNSGPFFQQVAIASTDIKIDYRASHVNLKALHAGDYLQLLNILPISGLELTLTAFQANGISGGVALTNAILEGWVSDIYSHQLHRVLSGTAPLKGLSNIGSGLHNLLYVPIDQFRKKDGRAVRQLQRSTKSLMTTLARETLDLSQKLSMFVAQTITDLVSDESTASNSRQSLRQKQQPKGLKEGLEQASKAMSRELSQAAETIVAVPVRQFERAGPSGLVTSVVRALPIAVLRPIAGLAEGISYTILGLRNKIDPDQRHDEEDIWNVDIGPQLPTVV